MSKTSNQKLKILYIMKMLMEKTDEDHSMTINEIIKNLEKLDISAERKSIYSDIDALKRFGIDISQSKTKTTGYYISNRKFELAELKLLVDGVQCSKFITHKKSHELIKKIVNLTSEQQASHLNRQVFVTNRVKTPNERIYYNVDVIHQAISQNRQISFHYFKYNTKKQEIYGKDGDLYVTSPYSLVWDDEKYYLIAFSGKYDSFTHYRVDRMVSVSIESDKREKHPSSTKFDITEYSKKVFSMFSGDETLAKLKFDSSLINVIIDKFGKNILIDEHGDNEFCVTQKISVSPTFFAWMTQFGSKAQIISPKSVIKKYREFIKEISDNFNI